MNHVIILKTYCSRWCSLLMQFSIMTSFFITVTKRWYMRECGHSAFSLKSCWSSVFNPLIFNNLKTARNWMMNRTRMCRGDWNDLMKYYDTNCISLNWHSLKRFNVQKNFTHVFHWFSVCFCDPTCHCLMFTFIWSERPSNESRHCCGCIQVKVL